MCLPTVSSCVGPDSRASCLIKIQVFPGEFEEEGDLGQGNEDVCKERIIMRGSKAFNRSFSQLTNQCFYSILAHFPAPGKCSVNDWLFYDDEDGDSIVLNPGFKIYLQIFLLRGKLQSLSHTLMPYQIS